MAERLGCPATVPRVSGRQRGRPRDPRAHEAILAATRDLLTTGGYERLTIEAVAARAGVGKQTVYRRWPTKSAVVADAVLEGYLGARRRAVPDTGDLAADLRIWLNALFTGLTDPATVAQVRGLAVAAAEEPEGSQRFHGLITGPQRDALAHRLQAAVAAGQLSDTSGIALATDVVLGLLLFRALDRRPVDPVTDAENVLRLLLTAVGLSALDSSAPTE